MTWCVYVIKLDSAVGIKIMDFGIGSKITEFGLPKCIIDRINTAFKIWVLNKELN